MPHAVNVSVEDFEAIGRTVRVGEEVGHAGAPDLADETDLSSPSSSDVVVGAQDDDAKGIGGRRRGMDSDDEDGGGDGGGDGNNGGGEGNGGGDGVGEGGDVGDVDASGADEGSNEEGEQQEQQQQQQQQEQEQEQEEAEAEAETEESPAASAAAAEVRAKGGKISNWHPMKASALADALDKHVHFAGAVGGGKVKPKDLKEGGSGIPTAKKVADPSAGAVCVCPYPSPQLSTRVTRVHLKPLRSPPLKSTCLHMCLLDQAQALEIEYVRV